MISTGSHIYVYGSSQDIYQIDDLGNLEIIELDLFLKVCTMVNMDCLLLIQRMYLNITMENFIQSMTMLLLSELIKTKGTYIF